MQHLDERLTFNFGSVLTCLALLVFAGWSCGGEEDAAAEACGNQPRGYVEKRLAFKEPSVPPGEHCVSEEQTRICRNGGWTTWTGDFEYDSCASGCADPIAENGGTKTRIRYLSAAVPFGEQCVSEEQSITCNDGVWSEWSANGYEFEECEPGPPSNCVDPVASHSNTMSRVRFKKRLVSPHERCEREEQKRTCENGTWTEWSGEFEHENCGSEPQASPLVDWTSIYDKEKKEIAFSIESNDSRPVHCAVEASVSYLNATLPVPAHASFACCNADFDLEPFAASSINWNVTESILAIQAESPNLSPSGAGDVHVNCVYVN